jgi:DNA-binding MarR family transcriptional regulator
MSFYDVPVSQVEFQRAAAFRSALRRFLARTNEVTATAHLTSQRYDLLLAIKTGPDATSTVTQLSRRLSLPQPAVTELVQRAEEVGLVKRAVSEVDRRVSELRLTAAGERRLLQAFVALREERRQLIDAMSAVDSSFRVFVQNYAGG